MKFTKIKIKNYKPYKGEQKIEVPQDGKIILIKGMNGAGKTTFLNGLVWTLYNESYDYKSIFNDIILYGLDIGEEEEMFIQIHFDHNNKNHILQRKIVVTKNAEKSYSFDDKRKLDIFYSNAKNDTLEEEISISNYINSILNESVKNYFFFDGARIERFTKDNHYKDVQKAIKNLLKIKTVERAKEHIQTIVEDIRRSINEEMNDDILIDISNEIKDKQEKLEEAKKKKDKIIKEKNNINDNLDNSLKELEHYEKNSDFKAKRDQYKNLYKEVEEEFNEKEKELEDKLKLTYVILGDNLFRDAVEILNDNYKSGELEVSSSDLKVMIKKTIKEHKCYLCDRELDNEVETNLKDKLPNLSLDNANQENYLQIKSKLNNALKEGSNLYNEISKKQKKIIDLKNKKKKYKELIAQYNSKIKDELPGAKEYRNVIKELRDRLEDLIDDKKDINLKIDNLKKELANLDEKYNKKSKKIETNNHKINKFEMSNKFKDIIDLIYNNYEKKQIPKINNRVKENFDSLIRKDNIYSDIFIDENYKINVLRKTSDDNKLQELSYGERQILSLSLILSLAEVSEDSAPFIMDTPLGNLDPVHRRKILKSMPSLVSQIFLLVTKSEFTQDLYDICYEDIAAEYELDFKNNGVTKIRNGV